MSNILTVVLSQQQKQNTMVSECPSISSSCMQYVSSKNDVSSSAPNNSQYLKLNIFKMLKNMYTDMAAKRRV